MGRTTAIGLLAFFTTTGCAASKDPVDGGERDASVPDASIPDASGMDAAMCTGEVPVNHMPEPVSCPAARPWDDAGPIVSHPGECNSDAQCDGGVNGRCTPSSNTTLGHVYDCTYDECFTNADCAGAAAGAFCACRDGRSGGANVCVAGNCAQDSDCGLCGYCSPTTGGCGGHTGTDGYYCHTPKDQCVNDDTCAAAVSSYQCLYPATGTYWTCGPADCAG